MAKVSGMLDEEREGKRGHTGTDTFPNIDLFAFGVPYTTLCKSTSVAPEVHDNSPYAAQNKAERFWANKAACVLKYLQSGLLNAVLRVNLALVNYKPSLRTY